jgi:single-strand DNA-binding protein
LEVILVTFVVTEKGRSKRMNISILSGRLVKAPELKTTEKGVAVCNFTLAVRRDYKDSNGEYITDFIDFVAWRGQAEFLCKFFGKGQWVEATGELQTRSYTDKDGNQRKVVEVVANKIGFAGDRKQSENPTGSETDEPLPMPEDVNGTITGNSLDDDLPF